MKTFLIASKNKGKIKEFSRILAPLGIKIVTESDANITLDDIEETGLTFYENARAKALAACKRSGLPSIADDSGLVVKALNGAPGVFSARFAGEGASDDDNINLLLKKMEHVPDNERDAKFVCVICCVFPDGREIAVEGECHGTIAREKRGRGGFGYDPVFITSQNKSFAQLNDSEKDAISHRGKALRKLAQTLKYEIKEGK